MLTISLRSRIQSFMRSRKPRHAASLALPVAALLLAGAALTPNLGTGKSARFAVVSVAKRTSTANPLGVRIHKVYGSNIPARVYGTEVADREDQGVNTRGEMVSDLSPLPASAFAGPVAAYKTYAEHWASVTEIDALALRRALAAGTLAQARSAWATTWSAYLRLGAVYGLFGTLNQSIDGTPGGLPGGTSDPRFTGLHRIEMGLWTNASPPSLSPLAGKLASDLKRLRKTLPGVRITPLEYATRAHEILEDAQRDLLSGTDVPWSGAGVLGTAAGLYATREVFHTLQPLLQGRENTEADVRGELLLLGSAIARVHRAHAGWPALAQLTMRERELLNGTLAGALGALELLPGTLETHTPPPLPTLPGSKP